MSWILKPFGLRTSRQRELFYYVPYPAAPSFLFDLSTFKLKKNYTMAERSGKNDVGDRKRSIATKVHLQSFVLIIPQPGKNVCPLHICPLPSARDNTIHNRQSSKHKECENPKKTDNSVKLTYKGLITATVSLKYQLTSNMDCTDKITSIVIGNLWVAAAIKYTPSSKSRFASVQYMKQSLSLPGF